MTSQIYQIDSNVHNSGKTVAVTKRRVTWKFGIANPSALADGRIGVECRGSEHEIKLIWSITSGKRSVAFDGQEVHFSQGKPLRENKFCFQWTEWGHSFYMIAHVAPPISKSTDFKMFDLLIDGNSFTSYPQIYQLGQVKPMKKCSSYHSNQASCLYRTVEPSYSSHFAVPRSAAAPQYDYRNDYYNIDSNKVNASPRQDSSPRASILSKSMTNRSSETSGLKIDLLGDVQHGNSATKVPDLLDVDSSPTNGFIGSTITVHDKFEAKSSSYEDISTSILNSYTSNDTETIRSYCNHVSQHQLSSVVAPASSYYPESSESFALIPSHRNQAYGNPFDCNHSYIIRDSVKEIETTTSTLRVDTYSPNSDDGMISYNSTCSPTCVSDIETALKKICNLDDISQTVLKPYKAKPALKVHNPNIPLSQLKTMSSSVPKKEIMRNQHIYQRSNGHQLVVYGQSPGKVMDAIF